MKKTKAIAGVRFYAEIDNNVPIFIGRPGKEPIELTPGDCLHAIDGRGLRIMRAPPKVKK